MASKLRVDEITGGTGSTVSIGTATFTGGLSGDITGLNVTGVITATTLNQNLGAGSSITIGDTFIKQGAVGLGTTDTAGRNAGVGTAVGTLVYNSTTNTAQVYTPDGWVDFGANEIFSATGGTIDSSSRPGYNVHTFTTPGSFTVNSGSKTVEYLVIAGGGGGGRGNPNVYGGGGGGAGGYRTGTLLVTTGDYPVVRGGGGAKAPTANSKGSPGTDSNFGTITSTGGGYGAACFASNGDEVGGPGGSGGGGGTYASPPYPGQPGGTGNAGGYTPAEGTDGGRSGDSGHGGGGGGGGASQSGFDGIPSTNTGGAGGDGSSSAITGTSVTRAGGGGGGGSNPSGAGGSGGGATGGYFPGVSATAATEYTGSGGGGSADPASDASAGASGIVIIAYPTS